MWVKIRRHIDLHPTQYTHNNNKKMIWNIYNKPSDSSCWLTWFFSRILFQCFLLFNLWLSSVLSYMLCVLSSVMKECSYVRNVNQDWMKIQKISKDFHLQHTMFNCSNNNTKKILTKIETWFQLNKLEYDSHLIIIWPE